MTFGTLFGVLDINPTIEKWDASKIASLKKVDATAVVHNDLIETWLASVGKRNFVNSGFFVGANVTRYDTSTTWPALRIVNRNMRLTRSTNLFMSGETFFMVMRVVTKNLWVGFWKVRPNTNYASNFWNSAEGNGELTSFDTKFMCTFDAVLNTGASYGAIGTVPFLVVFACRFQQVGTDIVFWTMGASGVVVTQTVTGTWRNNATANLELQTNGGVLHVYYCEINEEIKTTAQMLARRNELFNRYV